MGIGYWLRHPGRMAARARFWVWERRNPDKPWLCPGTIAFCESHLTPSMRGLEFGSGRSTRWFASKLGHLTSVEHHEGWYHQVKAQLAQAGITNVDYKLVPLDHPQDAPEREDYPAHPAYVAVAHSFPDQSLQFVLVDGHYRTNCIKAALPKIAPGGFLIVDDANLWPSRQHMPVPDSWPLVDESTNGLKQALIWQAPPR